MALITCGECRKEISSSAAACPGCGAPAQAPAPLRVQVVPRKSHPVLKVFGVIVLGFFSLVLIGGRNHTQDSAAPSLSEPTAPTLFVSSAKLAADYAANEVSADSKYKGARLQLTGVVQSVNRDFTDKVWVGIESSNQFMPIHAEGLSPERAAGLKKGQVISLTCTGSTMILGSPMLNQCE